MRGACPLVIGLPIRPKAGRSDHREGEADVRRLPGWISRADRDPVSLSGNAVLADGREVRISVTDLSRDGCRVECDETLKIGETIRLNVDAVDNVAAVVRWELCGTAGVRFLNPRWA